MTRIMVVEDSPTTRQMIAFALKRLPDSHVVEAVDGFDALNKLSSSTFDLILADINMPGMDGIKLVSALRSDPRYAATPIIIITTEGAAEDRKRAMGSGANAYLSKPVQIQDLLRTVKELLGR